MVVAEKLVRPLKSLVKYVMDYMKQDEITITPDAATL